MPRQLDIATLDGAAKHYAREWMAEDQKSSTGARFIAGPSYVLQDLFNATYKDEFEYLLNGVKGWMGQTALAAFEKAAQERFTSREDAAFHQLLRDRLAVDPEGNHIPGVIGLVCVGTRTVGTWVKHVKTRNREYMFPKRIAWPIYAGENEERLAGSDVPDDLPDGALSPGVGATVPNISAECAILAADAIVDNLDEGTTAATIRGRTGTQPVDPDASETGTLLFTLTMSDPAFGNAADGTPGGLATASAITDDSSADATGTLGYCRVGATGTGVDDHIDGEAGTSGADFNFNTLSIVSGSTVSMTSFTLTVPQGSTAT